MHNRAMLGGINGLAGEHGISHASDIPLGRQPKQQVQCLFGGKMSTEIDDEFINGLNKPAIPALGVTQRPEGDIIKLVSMGVK